MPAVAPDHIIARLFLRAVLPALPVYAQREESARRTIEGWRFAVRFASTSGVGTTLGFSDGEVTVDSPPAGIALWLLFLSDRDVVRAFRQEGRPWVLPWGGLHHLRRLPALSGLLADMAEVLNPLVTETTVSTPGWGTTPQSGNELRGQSHVYAVDSRHSRGGGNPQTTTKSGKLSSSGRRELRAELLLGTLLPAAVVELGIHEEKCRRLLAPLGDFVVQLSVPHLCSAWIRRRGDDWEWGRGPAPSFPDLQIEFRDPEIALSAVNGAIDALAASVTGEIAVRGMIPLADALTRVMERVSECLGQGRS